MKFSALLFTTLSVSLASAAPATYSTNGDLTCEYPIDADVSQFSPKFKNVVMKDGKYEEYELSSNRIILKKLPILQPGQTVTVKVTASTGEFVPNNVTFSGDDQQTSVEVSWKADLQEIKGDLKVMFDAHMTNYPCQPQVDAGFFMVPISAEGNI